MEHFVRIKKQQLPDFALKKHVKQMEIMFSFFQEPLKRFHYFSIISDEAKLLDDCSGKIKIKNIIVREYHKYIYIIIILYTIYFSFLYQTIVLVAAKTIFKKY